MDERLVGVTESGDVPPQREEVAIQRALVHIVLWSQFAVGDERMRRQTLIARRLGKPVLVVQTDDTPPPLWAAGAPVVQARSRQDVVRAVRATQAGSLGGAVLPPPLPSEIAPDELAATPALWPKRRYLRVRRAKEYGLLLNPALEASESGLVVLLVDEATLANAPSSVRFPAQSYATLDLFLKDGWEPA